MIFPPATTSSSIAWQTARAVSTGCISSGRRRSIASAAGYAPPAITFAVTDPPLPTLRVDDLASRDTATQACRHAGGGAAVPHVGAASASPLAGQSLIDCAQQLVG